MYGSINSSNIFTQEIWDGSQFHQLYGKFMTPNIALVKSYLNCHHNGTPRYLSMTPQTTTVSPTLPHPAEISHPTPTSNHSPRYF